MRPVEHSHGSHAHAHAGREDALLSAHTEERRAANAANQRRLLVVMVSGIGILIAEVIAGLAANSLALLSDAAHMSTDIAALALAYFAVRMSSRAPTALKSYGYYRAETVAAFVNALALWVVTAYFLFEAWRRLRSPPAVDGMLVAIVGGLSLVANLVMAGVLHQGHKESMNVRSAYVHVLSDALGSLAALVAGVGIYFYGARWLDPAMTVFIAALIVVWTWRLTRDSLHVLLEGTPARVNHDEVKGSIAQVPGVQAVHDLHVWSLTTGMDNLSAHVMVEDASEGPAIVAAIRDKLVKDHGLAHVTIEVETKDSPNCIRCD